MSNLKQLTSTQRKAFKQPWSDINENGEVVLVLGGHAELMGNAIIKAGYGESFESTSCCYQGRLLIVTAGKLTLTDAGIELHKQLLKGSSRWPASDEALENLAVLTKAGY